MSDEKNNKGYRNSGNLNSGYWNSGDWNSGDRNSGYWNSGDWNSGDRNSGDRNSGNLNSGDWNSGDRNSGYWNSGNLNSGDRNSGDRNSGNLNSGDWNSGNLNSGYFNLTTPNRIQVFGKNCSREDWANSEKPSFLFFNLTEWIEELNMSDQERIDNPKFHTTGGYLKSYEYKEAFQKSWDNASEEDRKLVEKLPNFDADIFFEISGIDIRQTIPQEIIIDGATYVLKK